MGGGKVKMYQPIYAGAAVVYVVAYLFELYMRYFS